MRIFTIFILGMMLLTCGALAQDESVSTAADALQSVLSDFKDEC